MAEPHKCKRWKTDGLSQEARLFTCGRLGRSKGSKNPVPDALVNKWVKGLPEGTNLVIVSLLGHKPDGTSEFSFYSFYGKYSFQEWLDRWHNKRSLKVVEFPTCDFRPIAKDNLAAISKKVLDLLSNGCTVVLMDSGGETRTGMVCRHMGFQEDSRKS